MRIPITVLAMLAVTTAAPALQAQAPARDGGKSDEPKWFTVEVVVFEQAGWRNDDAPLPDHRTPELSGATDLVERFRDFKGPIPEFPPSSDATGGVPLRYALPDSAFPGGIPDFLPVPGDDMALAESVSKLEQAGAYRPMAHLAWRQRAGAFGEARRILVSGGHVLAHKSPDLDSSTLSGNVAIASEPEPVHELVGTVALSEGRYLHLNLDLWFRVERRAGPIRVYPGEQEGFPAWRLAERRQIEPGKLQYFDHHRFGAIALVRPWLAEKKDEPDSEAAGTAANDDDRS